MKITKIGEPRVIISNPHGKHNYFGWPTAARLQDGKIAVVASGFRLKHICPFGKTVISYSTNDGETYTMPAPVMDTVLDDRDGGIATFGKSSVIVTSFNNTREFQRGASEAGDYGLAYLDTVNDEEEKEALGANFRFSDDYGITFGKYFKSPVTSPHGPTKLIDGSLLWVGTVYNPESEDVNFIQAHKINSDGSMEYVGEIENVSLNGITPEICEPHAIALDDGTIIVHIRIQHNPSNVLTIFQSKSTDNGKTWTKPVQILSDGGGAPAHLFKHSSGMLISAYGFRSGPPYGIRVMLSRDNGETWDTDHILYENNVCDDLGYPSTVELSDGSLLTIFYVTPKIDGPAVVMQQKWKLEE